MMLKKITICILLALLSVNTRAQIVPVGFPILEEYVRYENLTNNLFNSSFTIRPNLNLKDSVFNLPHILPRKTQAKGLNIEPLPVHLRVEYNSKNPYGRNNGKMLRTKGFQQVISAGMSVQWKFLNIELRPEYYTYQNLAYDGFIETLPSEVYRDYVNFYFNRVDLPVFYTENNVPKLTLGQSSVHIKIGKISFGYNSFNQWSGPGRQNSLLLSNNSRGIPQLTLFTNEAILTPIGGFEVRMSGGLIKNSGLEAPVSPVDGMHPSNYIPRTRDRRYFSLFQFNYLPKWINGLTLGFQRVSLAQESSIDEWQDYLPFFDSFFKGRDLVRISNEARDEIATLYAKWNWYKEGAEFYFEIGKNDHSINLRDFLISPNHSLAYTLGGSKIFEIDPKTDLVLDLELTRLSRSGTAQLRDEFSWYTHYQVRDGYTQNGEVIGAGIGPGSNFQYLGFTLRKGIKSISLFMERTVNNKDFAIAAFNQDNIIHSRAQGITPFTNSHNWVDFSIGTVINYQYKHLLASWTLQHIKSYNYYWNNSDTISVGSSLNEPSKRNNFRSFINLAYLL